MAGLKPEAGRIAGIYKSCFNVLTEGGQLLTVFGDADRYSTRAILCNWDKPIWELPIDEGMEARLEAGTLQLPKLTIDWTEAEKLEYKRKPFWMDLWMQQADPAEQKRRAFRVLELVKSSGKASPLLDQASPVGRRAAAGIERLKQDYMDGLSSLVGLGIGLTPSCDDLLGGMAAWMYLTGQEPAYLEVFGRFLKERGSVYTTAVSRNLLTDTVSGIINEEIYELVCAIAGEKIGRQNGEQADRDVTEHRKQTVDEVLIRLTGQVLNYGSTSGAETCLGIVLGCCFRKNGE